MKTTPESENIKPPISKREAIALVSISIDELGELIEQRVAAALDAQAPKPELLTREALAQALDTSSATISRLTKDGMPCIPVGDHKRYQLSAVLQWLAMRGAP